MGKRSGINLTMQEIKALVPKNALYRVQDESIRGLAIQVSPTGTKSWVLRYRLKGDEKSFTLGRWPEINVARARSKAEEVLGRVHGGEDPTGDRKAEREALTVNDLAGRFLEEHVKVRNKPSMAKEQERLLNKFVCPALGKTAIKDVDTGQVAAILWKIQKSTPVQGNRVRALLSKMFNKAEVWGFRPGGSNPVRGQDRAPEQKKERNLSDRELVALGDTFRAVEAANEKGKKTNEDCPGPVPLQALAALRLALLTGMRKAEMVGDEYKGILAMPWSEVDLEAGLIRISPERHKTGGKVGIRPVHLCAAAQEIIKGLPHVLGNPYVFPAERPRRPRKGEEKKELLPGPYVALQGAWERIRLATTTRAIKAWEKSGKKGPEPIAINDVTIHDLRRTFASVGARLGYPELFLAALLGHAAGTVTQGYARLNGDPLQEAAETIGGRITALLAGEVDLEAEKMKRAKAQ